MSWVARLVKTAHVREDRRCARQAESATLSRRLQLLRHEAGHFTIWRELDRVVDGASITLDLVPIHPADLRAEALDPFASAVLHFEERNPRGRRLEPARGRGAD